MRNKPEYTELSVVYWPSYRAGSCMQVLLVLFLLVDVIFCLNMIFDDTIQRDWGIIIIFLASAIGIALFFRQVLKSMYTRIEVSDVQVKINNFYTKEENTFTWNDVSEIYFEDPLWIARTRIVINLKDQSDKIFLVVSDVDDKKLLKFIPEKLWKNRPWTQ